MHGLTIYKLLSIENINHPNDYYIYFEGGYIVWNVNDSTLRFWLDGEFIQIDTIDDIIELRNKISKE